MPPKKKALAFLKQTPKADPVPSDCVTVDVANKDDRNDDSLDLFKRSKTFFPIIVEEQDLENKSRKTQSRHCDDDEEATPDSSRPSKRRKVSSTKATSKIEDRFPDTHNDLYGPATPPRRVSNSPCPWGAKSKLQTESPGSDHKKGKEILTSTEKSALLTPSRSNSCLQPEGEVIDLDSPSPDNDTPSRRTRAHDSPSKKDSYKAETIAVYDSDDDVYVSAPEFEDQEEDAFDHFVREAAEKEAAANARLQTDGNGDTLDASFGSSVAKTEGLNKSIAIKVFVHCKFLPDSSPGKDQIFGAKRLLDQNLGTVRKNYLFWLRKKGAQISEAMEREVFLTWKRRKIYEVTTGLTLGWQPNANGDLSTVSNHQLGFSGGGALLEAWTPETFDKFMAEEERQRMLLRGELLDEEDDSDNNDKDGEQEADQVQKIKVLLKEKDKEAFKLTVDVDATIGILMSAYRKHRNVPADKEIRLNLDGEWLAEKMTLEEADVEDLTTIEVYLR